MVFSFGSFGEKNTGGTFGFGRGELSSSDGTSRLGRGNGSLSFEQPASSAESSSNNSTNFGSSSVRRSSSSFRFANFASINRANSTSQEDKKDAKDPRQGSASNPGSLHDLNFNLSKSVFTTPSAQTSSSNPPLFRQLPNLQNGKPASNIKKLVISNSSTQTAESLRGTKRLRSRSSQEFRLATPAGSTPSSANSSASNTPDKRRKLNSPIPLGTAVRNPAISRIYEINKTAVDSGYWITPSLETLFSYTFDQLKNVEELQIGRKNYGTVRYVNPIDLSTINNLSEILGNMVVFGNLSVCVYPDEHKGGRKAPPGQELNMPAIVTLENVFIYVPVGKAKMKLTDPSDPRVKTHTQRFNERIKARGGEFITYDVASGVYVFKVEHFSSWGFTEDDLLYDDDEMIDYNQGQQQPTVADDTFQRYNTDSNLDFGSTIADDTFLHKNIQNGFSLGTDLYREYPEEDIGGETFKSNGYVAQQMAPTDANVAHALGSTGTETSTDLQDDVSLVDERGESVDSLAREQDEYNTNALVIFDNASRLDDARVGKDWIEQLTFASTFDSFLAPPILENETSNNTLLDQKSNITAVDLDNAIFGGASQLKVSSTVGQYRAAANKLRLPEPFVPFSFAKFSSTSLLVKDEQSPSSFSRADQVINNKSNSVPQYFISILKDLLSGSQITSRNSGFPLSRPTTDLTFDSIKNKFAGNSSRELNIILLASVLFDPLSILGIEGLSNMSHDAEAKQIQKIRSKFLSKWLSNVVAPQTRSQVAQFEDDPLRQTLVHLYGNEITKAALAASKGNNLHLATLIPLLETPDAEIRQIAQAQLEDWDMTGTHRYIPEPVLIVFELIAGNTLVTSNQNDSKISISKGLSWLQAFGLKLWYECTTERPLYEARDSYKTAFTSNLAPAPYVNTLGNVRHIEFELLELYGRERPTAESLINPLSCSNSDFNFQIPWILYHILVRSLGIASDPDFAIGNKLNLDFAAQLESQKHYVEAIFILSHISDDVTATNEIQQVVSRNIDSLKSEDIETLKTRFNIPSSIFHNAKALQLRYQGKFWEECEQLILAESWEEAHYRIIRKVAPTAIISNNLDNLLSLLLKFTDPVAQVSNWSRGGQIYLDYIYIIEELKKHASKSQKHYNATGQSDTAGLFFPISSHLSNTSLLSTLSTSYSSSGLTSYDIGIRLMKGLAEIDVPESTQYSLPSEFNIKVAVNIMAAFVGQNIKLLGLADQASLALHMKMDSEEYRRQTVELSSIYFRDQVSAA